MVLGVASLAQAALTLASYTLLLARLAPWSVAVLFAASIPAFLSEARLSTESFRLASWRAPETRRLNYLEWILTRDSHVKEVKLFSLGALILGRYKSLFEKFFREDRALALRRFAWGLSLTLASLAAFYACYALAARRAAIGQITLGDLTLYVAVFRQGQGAFQSILGGLSGLYEDALFMSNLFAFLDLPVEQTLRLAAPSPSANAPASATLPPGPLALELRDVSFRYPGNDKWALRHLSLTLAPGEVVALCGDNGAGKSTLVNLLLRLFDPTEGVILYGGRPLPEIPLDELRLRMSAVFQDFVRYQFSVAENIGLGFPPALDDRARIETAARAGGADAVVATLPQGLDTTLGGFFEKGQEISVGQWQKVATSRAFMRPAEILILDEPTASLDAEAEYEMWRRFQHLVTGKTALLISHRMSTLRLAHRIVVLRGGTIEEQGTHEALMARDGRYAHLFKLQAQGYVDS
jgi:ABC-type multidrug transport system fused ATPase/permease subunit